MKTLPNQISAAVLRDLADPSETHAVRVVMLKTSSPTQYRYRGVRRQYIFERDGTLGMHILDIPVSLWMQEVPSERYRDNHSLAHDLQSRQMVNAPFLTLVVPWKTGEVTSEVLASGEAKPAPDFIGPLRELLVKVEAPPFMLDAVDLAKGDDNSALVEFVKTFSDALDDADTQEASGEADVPSSSAPEAETPEHDPAHKSPKSEPSQSPAAIRMREQRARKKAENNAAKKVAKKVSRKTSRK